MFSPYDLNSNDNPRNITSQVQLRGENYEEWACAMRTSYMLKESGGLLKALLNDPKKEQWNSKIGGQSNLC